MMTGFPDIGTSKFTAGSSSDSCIKDCPLGTTSSKNKAHNKSIWSTLFSSTFTAFNAYKESSGEKSKGYKVRNDGWSTTVRKALTCNPMKRFQERILGFNKPGISSYTSEIWLLGVCYKISPEGQTSDTNKSDGYIAFLQDFSSRIRMTYRKGFEAIGDSKFTSDVNWGCMLRSSQMLVAQALLFHHLGRSWRRPIEKPFNGEYIKILHHFGDSRSSAFSIHNLLEAGKVYGLVPGSWLGPYAMCRAWESLAFTKRELDDLEEENISLPMAMYIVSGDEHGERGGAPVVCIDDAARLCSEFLNGQGTWAPLLLLVPLVLGLDKVNPRYIPSLCATFTFPQSLGILGGKPGASTYIVGVQDEQAIYLDPHEVQPQVVDISCNNPDADPSSYHCSVVRQMHLNMLDPSIAIGFYCRDKDDFEDFCVRSADLANQSNGAPLYTVSQASSSSRRAHKDNLMDSLDNVDGFAVDDHNVKMDSTSNGDDWQLL
ncbi:cysteine protease ATG4B-like isoform X1 [Nymphaea colorata]|nr:cysteine protease ATG4B-like isoform X1 [Nymphaea colorata]